MIHRTFIALRLYTADETPALAVAITDSSASKSVIAPSTGEYFLEVEVLSGATGYTLTTGLSQVSVRDTRSLNFIPGQVLVKFQPGSRQLAGREFLESVNLRLLA